MTQREREELAFEDDAREQPAESAIDALFARTETRAERRFRRLHADPRALAKEREQRPAFVARQQAERAAVPSLQGMIDAMEAYFGCDLLEVTQAMIDASIFRRPSGAVQAAERELAIISQLGLSASGMAPELGPHEWDGDRCKHCGMHETWEGAKGACAASTPAKEHTIRRMEALRDQLIAQYRAMTPEQIEAEESARKAYTERWREEHKAAVARQEAERREGGSVIALGAVALVCVSVLLLAWWARGVVLTWLAEGQALEQVAQLRAELAAHRAALHAEITEATNAVSQSCSTRLADVESIATAAKSMAHLNAGRRG